MAYKWHGKELLRRVNLAASRVVVRRTEAVLTTAVQSILKGPKTGRVYTRRGIEHQASAPGEAPANDTGRLAQSGKTFYHSDNLIGRVVFTTDYAEFLELGTQNMEPRPYLRPALDKHTHGIEDEMAQEIGKELK